MGAARLPRRYRRDLQNANRALPFDVADGFGANRSLDRTKPLTGDHFHAAE
jgi:hypothetical protein